MAFLLAIGLVCLAAQARGQNLASCADTYCGMKQCRIIERCWSFDCQIGTTCLEPEAMPISSAGANACTYDDPVLRSTDGGALQEIACSIANRDCPAGTTCNTEAGVCCTGEDKTSGVCPAPKPFQQQGSCKTFCRHDQECPGFQKCCQAAVGCNTCMDTEPFTTCESITPCQAGQHCTMQEGQCLSYPCHATPICVDDKNGTCPDQQPQFQTSCMEECRVDSNCPGEEKCCNAGGCNMCVAPDTSPFPSSSGSDPSLSSGFVGLGDSSGTIGTTEAPPSMGGFMDLTSQGGSDPSSSSSSSSATSSPGPTMTGSADTSSSSGGGSSSPFSSMLSAMRNANSGGSTGGATSFTTMLANVRKVMSAMKSSGGPTALNTLGGGLSSLGSSSSGLSSLGGSSGGLGGLGGSSGGLNSLGGRGGGLGGLGGSSGLGSSGGLNSLGSGGLNSLGGGLGSLGGDFPLGSGSGTLNSLSGLGSGGGGSGFSLLGGGGGGGGGLNPSMSGPTLSSLGDRNSGRSSSASSSGLRPQMPSLGGRRPSMQGPSRKYGCGTLCMASMMFLYN